MSGSHGSHDPAAVRAAVHEHIVRAIPDAREGDNAVNDDIIRALVGVGAFHT